VRITEEDTLDVFELDAWEGYVQFAVTEAHHEPGEPSATVQVVLNGSTARHLAAVLNHLADVADQQPRG
jgi:hypothetical protein